MRRFRKEADSSSDTRFDLIEIGAGGGSIAKVNALGLLEVGPESAGSHPGPASYNLGGQNPTVSDADLVLGYLNPDYFCGGEIILNRGKAEKAIEEKLAYPLQMTVEKCAWGIHNIVNENMASAARIHINEKGEISEKWYWSPMAVQVLSMPMALRKSLGLRKSLFHDPQGHVRHWVLHLSRTLTLFRPLKPL
jgi:hypothetical protein